MMGCRDFQWKRIIMKLPCMDSKATNYFTQSPTIKALRRKEYPFQINSYNKYNAGFQAFAERRNQNHSMHPD